MYAGSVVLRRYCFPGLQPATTTAAERAATTERVPDSILAAVTGSCWRWSLLYLRLRCRFRVRQHRASWRRLPRMPGKRGLAETRTCCSTSPGGFLLLLLLSTSFYCLFLFSAFFSICNMFHFTTFTPSRVLVSARLPVSFTGRVLPTSGQAAAGHLKEQLLQPRQRTWDQGRVQHSGIRSSGSLLPI